MSKNSPYSPWGKIARSQEEGRFLQGPLGRLEDLCKAAKIFAELIRGFRTLHFVGPCTTVFGSARFEEGTPSYELAREVGRRLAEVGFTTLTGGGPGIMEAANRGAFEMGDLSIGFNISLPREQTPNPYLTPGLSIRFHYFALRKMHFMIRARSIVVYPGGFGSLDELFEMVTLMQTNKVERFPIILVGKSFWDEVLGFQKLIDYGVIDAADMQLIHFVDSAQEAWDHIAQWYELN